MFPFRKKLENRTDEELMQLICDADEQAFTTLYMRYSQKMLRFIYRLLRSDEEKAQDMLQDLFMKIVEHPERYDQSLKFSPWIYKVAGNMCFNEIRNTKNRLRLVETEFTADELIQKHENIFTGIDAKNFSIEYNRHFNKLEEEQQLLLTLRFQQELQIKEIAEIMNIAEGTVKSRIFYLLKKFSVLLHEFNPAK
ncbi:MAG: sigma-70 family RNA polymerase sigma factor [Sphingobacteriales bacterium]|nr:MAG: sigma-70 family RNA polymerase sigma factor [Sphingobacteriales bacterium]